MIASRPSAMPGISHTGHSGWNILSSSCRPRKYQRGLRRVRRRVDVGEPSSGAFTHREDHGITPSATRIERTRPPAGGARRGPCPPGFGLGVCWIEPDLTTVSRRWVWPPGPVAVGGGRDRGGGGRLRPQPAVPRRRHRLRAWPRACANARAVRGMAALVRSSTSPGSDARGRGRVDGLGLAGVGAGASSAADVAPSPPSTGSLAPCGARPACGDVRGSQSWFVSM